MYNLFFYLHILGVVCVAAPITLHLASVLMGDKGSADTLMAVYRLSAITGQYFAAIGGVIALITGLTMVTINTDDPDVGWGRAWVWTALVLYVTVALVGAVFLARSGRVLVAELPNRSPSYQTALRQYHTYSYIFLVLWLAIVSLMVFKPF
jgi:uncharacterized membrane protein